MGAVRRSEVSRTDLFEEVEEPVLIASESSTRGISLGTPDSYADPTL